MVVIFCIMRLTKFDHSHPAHLKQFPSQRFFSFDSISHAGCAKPEKAWGSISLTASQTSFPCGPLELIYDMILGSTLTRRLALVQNKCLRQWLTNISYQEKHKQFPENVTRFVMLSHGLWSHSCCDASHVVGQRWLGQTAQISIEHLWVEIDLHWVNREHRRKFAAPWCVRIFLSLCFPSNRYERQTFEFGLCVFYGCTMLLAPNCRALPAAV